MGLEAYRYACNVKWLGMRGHDLELIPEPSLVPLRPRDLQIAKSLNSSGILPVRNLQGGVGKNGSEWEESRNRGIVFSWIRLLGKIHST